MIKTGPISLETRGHADIQDITRAARDVLRKSELKSGTVTLFCPSSTSALTTIEYESGALQDLRRLFDEIVSPQREYAHNMRWGDGNGYSHVRAALLGPSLTVPFLEGEMTLGTWQQIVYVDFDTRPRQREIVMQIMGE